jgi:hypothetical protein
MGQPTLGNDELTKAVLFGAFLLALAILVESFTHPRREALITVRGHDVEVRPIVLEHTA